MENYLNQNSYSSLTDIINYIKNSDEFIKCNELKSKMSKDESLLKIIENVKVLQKKYISSQYDVNIKQQLDDEVNLLNRNALYCEYNYYLGKVNNMIDLVRDELNRYFSDVVGEDF